MSGLEFIAAITNALVWPVAIIVLVLVLRKPLSELIPAPERLKFKDLVLEFNRRVHEVATEADAILPEPPEGEQPEIDEELEELANTDPKAAIIESWLKVEDAAAEAVRSKGRDFTSRELKSPLRLVNALEKAEIIDEQQAAIFHDLSYIRNAVTHVPDIVMSPSTAHEYISTASRVASILHSSTTME